MRVTTYGSAPDFLAVVRPPLAEHEAEHHLVLGVAEALTSRPLPDGELFAASINDADGLVLAALMTGHHPLLVASDRESLRGAASLLWDTLDASGKTPSHVIGAVGQVEAVIESWGRRGGRTAHIAMRQRAYKLTSVEAPPAVSGTFRVATDGDLELVTRWVDAFHNEAFAGALTQPPRSVAERRVSAGDVYLWCDPEPRTMAGCARPTRRAIAVNGVYTPLEWRGRGYATACVAELSGHLLRRGFEFCVLYTDLSNPTSNAIYTRIGYRPVRDFLMYTLP